ncbi:MAG: cryptochrome/photolyase family protein [Bacteroidales bacterium]|nr:cryptochrome/photolyase family protein [Bacteroidales bacterium]
MKRKILRLILGDQLNVQHSWFSSVDSNVTYLMMEVRSETEYVKHHIQKVIAVFTAMREFAFQLQEAGHRVHYIHFDDPGNTHDFSGNVSRILKQENHDLLEYQMPDEYRLDQEMIKLAASLEIPVQAKDTEHFYTSRYELSAFFNGKNFLLESFYRHMRRKHNILMEDDKPLGGKWNYDVANRKKLPPNPRVVKPLVFNHDHREIYEMILSQGIKCFGEPHAEAFPWPLNREESLEVLRFFVKQCLPNFGKYQDAMHTDYWSIYHSRLSFSLNTKMLSPAEVVEAAIEAYDQNAAISIEQVEGFIRQIIGWREFMRGVYWDQMPDYENRNFFDHQNPLPDFFWTGNTKMNCLHHAIGQSLDKAYAHHIQRLMVTGNFALLAGIHPDEVDQWYLGIYIDAFHWVELTNTRGMSQFADAGMIATKPYISSANYIDKMSNYCKSCHYHKKQRVGEKACPFNSLYWNFLESHRIKLQENPRMKMMYRAWHNMTPEQKEAILMQAREYLKHPEQL